MKKSRTFDVVVIIMFAALALLTLYPFYNVIILSFSNTESVAKHIPYLLPFALDLTGYKTIIQDSDFINSLLVSLFVTIVGTAVNMVLSVIAAYVLSRKYLDGRNMIMSVIVFTMLFGGGLVPTYLMYVNYLHIKNTIWALIVPGFLLSANNVLMIRSYFNTSIPDALFEAAKIDGAGHMKIFTSITLPLGKPILVTMGLFSALGYWNDWTNGLYYLSGNEGQKLYSIQNLLNQMITDIQYLASGKVTGNIGAEVAKLPTTSIRMAIAFIAMLPLFIIYPFLQKYFAEGITLGAVKG